MNNRGKNVGLLLTGMALGATLCGGATAAGIIAAPTSDISSMQQEIVDRTNQLR